MVTLILNAIIIRQVTEVRESNKPFFISCTDYKEAFTKKKWKKLSIVQQNKAVSDHLISLIATFNYMSG